MADAFDYIVVGSGAGGGTLAARLAEAGRRCFCWKPAAIRGSSRAPMTISPASTACPTIMTCRRSTASPARTTRCGGTFSSGITPRTRCSRRTRNTGGTTAASRSTAFSTRAPEHLGGCTAHNAMILVYPHNADWDGIARLTGDQSWNAEAMRRYFMRLENCHHRPLERGWRRWAPTRRATAGTAGCRSEKAHIPSGRRARFRAWSRYCSNRRIDGVRRYRTADRTRSSISSKQRPTRTTGGW